MDIIQTLAQELDKAPQHVENVVRLLDEGNTIPFIARYRKELHGAMDDASLRTLEERLQYLRGLEERREAVKRSIDEQGKLTDELAAAIDAAAVDVTLPGRAQQMGTRHLINRITDEISEIFLGLGYTVAEGPEVETDY